MDDAGIVESLLVRRRTGLRLRARAGRILLSEERWMAASSEVEMTFLSGGLGIAWVAFVFMVGVGVEASAGKGLGRLEGERFKVSKASVRESV